MPELYTLRVRKERLSAEFLLAAASCIWPLQERREERIRQQLAQNIRWDLFLRVVRRHRIVGLACYGLKPFADQVPSQTVDELDRLSTLQTHQSLRRVAETVRVVRGLRDAGIETLVLKGPPLAMLAYGNLALRHSKDIDLLVSPDKVESAACHLEAAGYRRVLPSPQATTEDLRRWRRPIKNFEYVHSASQAPLELHWRFTDNRYLDRYAGFDRLLSQRREVAISSGLSLPAMPEDELLLYLCVHGATHAWSRLKWLADVGALLHQPETAERLLQQARERGLERPVEQAFALCNNLFGWAVPRATKSGMASRTLVRVAMVTLSAGDGASEVGEFLFGTTRISLSAYLLRSDWRYRFEQMRFDAVSHDPIPSSLPIWLQPLQRIYLWMWRRLSNSRCSPGVP